MELVLDKRHIAACCTPVLGLHVFLDHLQDFLVVKGAYPTDTVRPQMILHLLHVDAELAQVLHELILALNHVLYLFLCLVMAR